MTVEPGRVLESKSAYRQRLASLPIVEKLRLLDAMAEREIAIRRDGNASASERRVFERKSSQSNASE